MNKPLSRIQAALAKQWPRKAAQRVEVSLPYPPSTNRLFDSNHRLTERYRVWRADAGNMLEAQRPGSIQGRYKLTLTLEDGRRKIDLDNSIKAVSDLLVSHRVITDDRHAVEIVLRWSHDVDGARVTVEAAG